MMWVRCLMATRKNISINVFIIFGVENLEILEVFGFSRNVQSLTCMPPWQLLVRLSNLVGPSNGWNMTYLSNFRTVASTRNMPLQYVNLMYLHFESWVWGEGCGGILDRAYVLLTKKLKGWRAWKLQWLPRLTWSFHG